MLKLLNDLLPLRLAHVSPGADACGKRLRKELPFKAHAFKSGSQHNGWVVPDSWEALHATIHKDGRLIYDGMAHPLGVIIQSQSFKGRIPLAELKKHLFYQTYLPSARVYHCDLSYKPWRKDWGFSVPLNFFNALQEGMYDVDLQTRETKGSLKVWEYVLPGKSKETIFLNAHNCHPAQANDDIAGIVVGVEAMKRLAKRKNFYTYRLFIAPEIVGTVFYAAKASPKLLSTFKAGIFLEMLGSDTPLVLQESFSGLHEIDFAAHRYLKAHHPDHHADKFRKVVGNDETVWEAPGYEIPTISLSRFPYPEYRTDQDTAAIIREERLEEAVQAVLGISAMLESNIQLQRHFKGLVALSNPKYNLYFSPGDPSIPIEVGEQGKKWNELMNYLPRYFDGQWSIRDIADRHGIPFAAVHDYLLKFQAKGLVTFTGPGAPPKRAKR